MYSVNESTPYVMVCAVLSEDIEVYMPTVTLTTADFDATGKLVDEVQTDLYIYDCLCHVAGSDYDEINVNLTFGPGNLMQCVRINITDDDCVEPDQIFTVSLSDLQNAPSSVTLGADISANMTILDDGECD